MYLLLWILSFPSLVYHSFLFLILMFIFLYYKISNELFRNPQSTERLNHYQQYIKEKQTSLMRIYNQRLSPLTRANINTTTTMTGINSKTNPVASSKNHLIIALVVISSILIISQDGILIKSVDCLEPDAILIRPFADVAKSIISAVTIGKPLGIQLNSTDLARSFISFSWRTGFPVKLPTGFIDKGQKFYNNIIKRVNETNVSRLQRKRLINLKVDLDNIVDSLVEHVRQSPEGLYSDWSEAKVNGTVPIEEAIYKVGLQFKAYGIDIANYRNIAGAVLGVPGVPTVAKHVVNAGKAAAPIAQLPGNAFKKLSNSFMNRPAGSNGLVVNANGELIESDYDSSTLLEPTNDVEAPDIIPVAAS